MGTEIERDYVAEIVETGEVYDLDLCVVDLIKRCEAWVSSVPDEFRNKVEIEFEGRYEDASRFSVLYYRLETEAEYEERVIELAGYEKQAELREKIELQRLLDKYGLAGLPRRNFVSFYLPGAFVAEEVTKPIETWDVDQAIAMAGAIGRQGGLKPFGFRFTTREPSVDSADMRIVKSSGTYYFGGFVQTLEEIEAAKSPKDAILLENMKCNDWPKVISVAGMTFPLREDDMVLEALK